MRLSNYLYTTMKDTPKEAEIPSHQLMLRAGLINRLGAGIYTYLPLGLRILKKIENIIREELDRIDAHELLMPVIQPKELWETSGRWDKMSDLMFTSTDKNGKEYCLGPTHEEVITDLFSKIVKSYKNLPVSLYQIQLKYRDEIRPRFGVMRSREFFMKDAYSFHKDKESLKEVYENFYQAYCRIFERCGFKFRPVEADSGDIGGDVSHEFMALAGTGEDDIVYCEKCNYASNVEKAKGRFLKREESSEESKQEEIYTPEVRTIQELTDFFSKKEYDFIKSLVYTDQQENIYLCLIRGDLEINEVKLSRIIDGNNPVLADNETVEKIFGCPHGFIGPLIDDSKIRILADVSIKGCKNMISGANKKDYHIKGINVETLNIKKFFDIHKVTEKFTCGKCSGELKIERGIEVGHIFQLDDKYSKTSKTTFTAENGREQNVIMGCYGIGVSRVMAALIEQHYDEKGIVWPLEVAPYLVSVIPVDSKNKEIMEVSDKIYTSLIDSGVEAIFDDRPYRAGFKFKDSDLTGIPYKLIVGKKFADTGKVEIEKRTGEKSEIDYNDIIDYFKNIKG